MEKAEALNASIRAGRNVQRAGEVGDLAANAYAMNSTIPRAVHSVNRFRSDASCEDTTVSKIRTTSTDLSAVRLTISVSGNRFWTSTTSTRSSPCWSARPASDCRVAGSSPSCSVNAVRASGASTSSTSDVCPVRAARLRLKFPRTNAGSCWGCVVESSAAALGLLTAVFQRKGCNAFGGKHQRGSSTAAMKGRAITLIRTLTGTC
jgi:hypothetical protein